MKDDLKKNEGLDFISIAVHQLRTPLISMKWIAELLLKGEAGKLNSEQKEFLTDLYKSIIRMNQLINHLLSVAKIESNQLMIKNGEVNPNEVLEEVLQELELLFQDKDQSLSFKIRDLPILKIDRGILSQILKNLLTNSIKYAPRKGKIEVEFSFDKKKNKVLFSVRDNGMGIPKSEQAKIFQRFFRASNAAKSDSEGTGLGLYIVKKFVDMLGGRIWFESEENKGTVFYLTLPANQ